MQSLCSNIYGVHIMWWVLFCFTCTNSINCKATKSIIFLMLERRKLRHMEISDLPKVI